jgi:membrane protease YdiL (CAAX protease family)
MHYLACKYHTALYQPDNDASSAGGDRCRSVLAESWELLVDKLDVPSESARRLIAAAIGWELLALAPTFAFGIALAPTRGQGGAVMTENIRSLLTQIVELEGYGIILFAALVRGRIVGHGEARVGLGYEAISKPLIIASMAVLIAVYAVLVSIAHSQTRPDLLSKLGEVSPSLRAYLTLRVVLLAPPCEELFYRGWLWTGLQRHWGALPTAALTGTVWLALHFDRQLTTLVLLLPVAVILSVARYVGRSVRASIALHMLYNFIVITSPWALKTAGLL